jgi:hypothetical protein
MPISADHKNQAFYLLEQLAELHEEVKTACEDDEDTPDELDHLDDAEDSLQRFCRDRS